MDAPTDNELALLAVRVGASLQQRGLRAVTAESCTGGYLAKLLTDVPGSSAWFDSGLVTYSNQSKQKLLRVAAETLRQAGAVSEETVREMAGGALAVTGADRAVAISGVAGPDGGTAAHPVGEVWFCLARRRPGGTVDAVPSHRRFPGHRDAIRRLSAAHALGLLLDE